MRRKRGQSILEYTLMITAVVLAIIWAANNVIGTRVKGQYDAANTMLGTANTKLTESVGD